MLHNAEKLSYDKHDIMKKLHSEENSYKQNKSVFEKDQSVKGGPNQNHARFDTQKENILKSVINKEKSSLMPKKDLETKNPSNDVIENKVFDKIQKIKPTLFLLFCL